MFSGVEILSGLFVIKNLVHRERQRKGPSMYQPPRSNNINIVSYMLECVCQGRSVRFFCEANTAYYSDGVELEWFCKMASLYGWPSQHPLSLRSQDLFPLLSIPGTDLLFSALWFLGRCPAFCQHLHKQSCLYPEIAYLGGWSFFFFLLLLGCAT